MYRLLIFQETFKSIFGYGFTLFMAAKPIEWNDTLGIVGKIVWIIASLLATIWWSTRIYNRYFKKRR